ncbi:hypothetical protein BpHYR1_038650 [Brachionus plicatilis]|uniref:Uncharacterized protein n=1 Tax=Brachionus plicatilis TaxID=10195 RepID=A0A3M7RKR5_BRAPC|nr:hypothetical protein BpHYR1_038650 [Brachionus plicatilis]
MTQKVALNTVAKFWCFLKELRKIYLLAFFLSSSGSGVDDQSSRPIKDSFEFKSKFRSKLPGKLIDDLDLVLRVFDFASPSIGLIEGIGRSNLFLICNCLISSSNDVNFSDADNFFGPVVLRRVNFFGDKGLRKFFSSKIQQLTSLVKRPMNEPFIRFDGMN